MLPSCNVTDVLTGEDRQLTQVKVDKLKQSYSDLDHRCDERLAKMEQALPLAANFRKTHEKLTDLLQQMEPHLRSTELTGAEAEAQVKVRAYLKVVRLKRP